MLLRAADAAARQVNRGGWGSVYFPAEFFEYLSSDEAVDWVFDQRLLGALKQASESALSGVEPQHFRAAVEKFVEGPALEEHALAFVQDYLAAHEVEGTFRRLASALAALRRMEA